MQGIAELNAGDRRQGTTEIMLHVDPSRAGALKLYEAVGFVQDEVLRDYYADRRDAIVMKLRTTPAVPMAARMAADAGAAALAQVAAQASAMAASATSAGSLLQRQERASKRPREQMQAQT